MEGDVYMQGNIAERRLLNRCEFPCSSVANNYDKTRQENTFVCSS